MLLKGVYQRETKMITISAQTKMAEEFVDPRYFRATGLVRRKFSSGCTLYKVLQEGRNRGPRAGWKTKLAYGTPVFIKKLGNDEFGNFPADRFTNSINLTAAIENEFLPAGIPNPHGIVYQGNLVDATLNKSPAYFISEYVPGRNLMEEIALGKIPQNELENVLRSVGQTILTLRGFGIYHMDFAPRDIVVFRKGESFKPYLVDTEHVVYNGQKRDVLLRAQIKQFNEDYGIFFKGQELDSARETFFKGYWGED